VVLVDLAVAVVVLVVARLVLVGVYVPVVVDAVPAGPLATAPSA